MPKLSDNRRAWLVCLVLISVTLALYWPVRHYDFVQYDDPDYVSENQTVRDGLTTYGLMWSFVDVHVANWHPVTWISHMLDCQLFGVNPGAHHLVNAGFHCANAALLFLLLRTMTGAFWRSAFVAALFAWHPLRVESVAWISERKDVLSGFFFLLTLLAYVRFARSPSAAALGQTNTVSGPEGSPASLALSGRGGRCAGHAVSFAEILKLQFSTRARLPGSSMYLLSLALFTLGLLSKAMLVTVPLVLLLLDFWPLRRFQLPANGAFRIRPSASTFSPGTAVLLLEKLPFFLLSLAVGLITVFAQKSAGAVASLRSEGLMMRLAEAATNYLLYLEKILWPRDLACLYLRPQHPSVPLAFCAALLILAVSWLALRNAAAKPYFLVGWFWFLIMLLPVIGLAQIGLQSIADRYTYLPAIGLALIATWAAGDWVRGLAHAGAVYGSVLAAGAAVLLLCLMTRAAPTHLLAEHRDLDGTRTGR